MVFLSRCVLILLAPALACGQVAAASFGENRAYDAAAKAFKDGFWDRAETGFAQFIGKYPQSGRVSEAVLMQAEAQYCSATNHLQRREFAEANQKFAQAIDLLTARQPGAGRLADLYLYWIGEAYFQNTNYAAAADTFGRLTRDYSASARRLEASVGEAAARAKLEAWPQVVALLQNPAAAFQQAAQAEPASEWVAHGWLLLTEAELAQQDYAAAEVSLKPLEGHSLKLELDWQRRYLLCRIKLGAGRMEEALKNSADLVSLAETAGRGDLLAVAIALRAGILEQMNDRQGAIAAYRRNLAPNAPLEQQRQAILNIAELAIAGGHFVEAEQSLEQYLAQFTNSPVADLALLTLGELHLKDAAAAPTDQIGTVTNGAPTGTNQLQQAIAIFDRLIRTFPNSPLAGKAQLDQGWCLWLEGRIPESIDAFKAAVAHLPPSEDRVVARCKLADAQFRQGDYAGALQSYRTATDEFAQWPGLKAQFGDSVLYQNERAAINLKDMASATNAVEQILKLYPASAVVDRSLLLLGQGYADLGEPKAARAWLGRLVQSSPGSPLLPEAELAIARTRVLETDWTGAISNYDAWLDRFPTNLLRPDTEYYRGWANFQAGHETNALTLFTNFLGRFPTNALAPQAQQWVADYYFRQGDFQNAEKNYQLLYQTWPASELAYPARMMAGRAAAGRLSYSEAISYFTNLTSDLNCPPELKSQALFAYGDALVQLEATETNRLGNLEQAIRVFGKIPDLYPASAQAARAWGEIGNCYFQMAATDPTRYEDATNAYRKVIASPQADVAARSEAEFGLGLVAEKQAGQSSDAEKTALLKQARDYYLDVFYGNDLREGEKPDLFWKKKAGLEAARLAESLQEWAQAVNLYRDLQQWLPPLQAALEKKIAKAQEHLVHEEK